MLEELTEAPVRVDLTEARPMSPGWEDLEEQARQFAFASKSENTRRAYRADWADLTAWCLEHQVALLPLAPHSLALYLTDRSRTCKVSTLQRRLSCISVAHQMAGLESPTRHMTVRTVWAGIRRTKGVAVDAKNAIQTDLLRRMVRSLPQDTLAGLRDSALLVMDYAGAFRRSELVSLDVQHVRQTEDGLICQLQRSKTDQEGAGREVGLPYGSRRETCPVRSYLAWLRESGITEGPIFRPIRRNDQIQSRRLSDRSVALIIKRAVQAVGLDPTGFAGHSLRAGLATAAAAEGVPDRVIMKQTGHRSVDTLSKYIREGQMFRDNAAAHIGL